MWVWFRNNIDWLMGGIGITALSAFFGITRLLYKHLYNKYCWIPQRPLKNENPSRDISQYLKNPAFDFSKGDFTGEIVSGENSFLQSVQKFVLTERNKYEIYDDDYGIEEAITIFTEKKSEEFLRQCNHIALRLMDVYNEWIQEIYKIFRKNGKLIIEMKVKGIPYTLKCEIPNIHKAGE